MDNPLVNPAPPPALADLEARLTGLTVRDRQRLQRRIDGARRTRDQRRRSGIATAIARDVERAELRVAAREASVPRITYPEQLPVSQKKDDIAEAIRDHQVVIVAGETGSGKTTQLPKICLELGRGVRGLVGHTQPRRLAARTVAERIAEELDAGPLGGTVGYQVRFTEHVGEDTLVKLMTDGILLNELQHDRMLSRYDTLIIDEAHERSLNIDFILGYLRQLLPQRPDLKVVITSATIDPERFSRHFHDAPIIEVSGRTYPVEVRYRPVVQETEDEDGESPAAVAGSGDRERDQTQAILDAVGELSAEGPGDILVFLSGEREIRDTADALTKADLRNTEITPLYARLSSAEQHRVFQPHTGRRIVLATNVAETSLTVPGIKYVIDPGTARISRYSHRTKVQRLPIEAVSQASANQRKGRCGRVSEGVCIRLYSEDDFLSRPQFTDPEILRTNLASVILQMTAIGLGDIAAFPFIDPPDSRNIKDGISLLHELGAIDPDEKDVRGRLTPLGRRLAQLPLDPRLARMIVEADRNGVVREVMVIAAALSIQDPRERPQDKQTQAQQSHARFTDPESDFLTFLNLWNYVRERQKELSSSQFRRMCKQEYLNWLRIREWQDIVAQLRQVLRSMDVVLGEQRDEAADPKAVHLSMLSGLLSHIGLKDADKQDYGGARGARFAVFPGSALFKKTPRWVMAAELVETSRLWGRICAKIEPEWAESLAGHLVKRNYSEPHWEQRRGSVVAFERVTLYGVPIVAQRKVQYGRIDPEVSRDLFIRHALVQGEWRTHHAFFAENRALLEEVAELEHRARRRDILVDDETLYDFYDARVPQDVVSVAHFDKWWKKARHETPDLLNFSAAMLVNDRAGGISEDDYPDVWEQDGLRLSLTYQFEPGADADGVTVHVPLDVLNQLGEGDGFDWQIPGLREEVATALIRSLPKAVRRNFVPAPDHARAALREMTTRHSAFTDALGRALQRATAVPVPRDAWDWSAVPPHLRMTFRVVDDKGRTVGEGKNVEALRDRLAGRVREAISQAGGAIEQSGLTSWTVGELPRLFEQRRGGQVLKAFPALVDEGTTVAVRLFGSEAEQRAAMWAGTRRLLLLNTPSPLKAMQSGLPTAVKLTLSHSPHGSTAKLFDDCIDCAADQIMAACGGPAWDEAGFTRILTKMRAELAPMCVDVVVKTERVLAAWRDVERRLKSTSSPALVPALADVREQVAALVHPGFVTETGRRRLPDVLRYLRGAERRLVKLPNEVQRDRIRMETIRQLTAEYRELVDALPPGRASGEDVQQIRWMLEELRVSYFAQSLGTPSPVSDKRIIKAMDAVEDSL